MIHPSITPNNVDPKMGIVSGTVKPVISNRRSDWFPMFANATIRITIRRTRMI